MEYVMKHVPKAFKKHRPIWREDTRHSDELQAASWGILAMGALMAALAVGGVVFYGALNVPLIGAALVAAALGRGLLSISRYKRRREYTDGNPPDLRRALDRITKTS